MAEGKLGMNKESDWLQSAACAGKSEMFTVRDLRLAEGETYSEAKHKLAESQKFKDAIKICQSCPVQQQCGETAEPEDWSWTVRAGRMPAVFNTRGRGRPRTTPEPINDKVCGNGHVGRMSASRRGRCYGCEEERKQIRNPPKGRELKNECVRGHKGMYERDARNVRFCRGCKREDRLKWEKSK